MVSTELRHQTGTRLIYPRDPDHVGMDQHFHALNLRSGLAGLSRNLDHRVDERMQDHSAGLRLVAIPGDHPCLAQAGSDRVVLLRRTEESW